MYVWLHFCKVREVWERTPHVMSYHTEAFGSLVSKLSRDTTWFFSVRGSLVKNLENKWQTGYSTGNYMCARLQRYVGTSFTRWWCSSFVYHPRAGLVFNFYVFFLNLKRNRKRAFKQQSCLLVSIIKLYFMKKLLMHTAVWKYIQYIANIYVHFVVHSLLCAVLCQCFFCLHTLET